MSENLHDQLNRLVSGYWYTQTIYVAAFESMEHLYQVILHDLAKELPAPTIDSSA